MLKPVLQLAAVGIAGVVLLKLAALLVFPLLGLLFKILLVCAVVFFAMRLLRTRKDAEAETNPWRVIQSEPVPFNVPETKPSDSLWRR